MNKIIWTVYTLGCGFKEKGQVITHTASERKNAVSMSVTLYFTPPFESESLNQFEIEET